MPLGARRATVTLKAKIFAVEFTVRRILFPGNEQFWHETLRSFDHIARQLFDHLTCPKTFLEFTADEGADAHCPGRRGAPGPGPDLQLAR